MLEVLILKPDAIETAEAGTTESVINITNHGLETGEMIINNTRNELIKPASRVITKIDDNSFSVNVDIDDQQAGDEIALFKYVDVTDKLRARTLNIHNREDRSSCSFVLEIDDENDIPRAGQQLKILDNSIVKFGGAIISVNITFVGHPANREAVVRISSEGYDHVPARRTITIDISEPTQSGVIVERMVDNFLFQEGITKGTIIDGYEWPEYPLDTANNAVSIRTILDEMASASGARWFIDNNRQLNFIQEATLTGDVTISEGDIERPANFSVVESLIDFRNKQFLAGAQDTFFEEAIVVQDNVAETEERQARESGSGVWGNVIEDPNVEDISEEAAGAGTTTTNVNITDHGVQVGDMVLNNTRGRARRNVEAVVDNNNFTVRELPGQTEGDIILLYPNANTVVREKLARYGSVTPQKLNFKTHRTDIEPRNRIELNFNTFGLFAGKEYLVEDVNLYDFNGKELRARVSAVAKDLARTLSANEDWIDTFGEIARKDPQKPQIVQMFQDKADALVSFARNKYIEIVDEVKEKLKENIDTGDVDTDEKIAELLTKIHELLIKNGIADKEE